MSYVESIINFDKWSATTFLVPFSSSISSRLKVSKMSESWLTSLCLVMTWGNGSTGGESVFSLQCSGLTPSLPSEIDSSSFSQGLRMGFSITLPLWRVMTDWTWSMCWLPELLAFTLYCPFGFCCGWDGNLPLSWKLRVNVNFARVSLKSAIVWAFWVLIISCFAMNACKVSLRFLLKGEHKEVHIHENFRNYGAWNYDSSSFSQGLRMGFSITLPLWRVMTDWTWSMCWLPELLVFTLYCPFGFCCGWDGNLPLSWKLRVNVNFARVSLKSAIVWAFWVLIISCFSMNACKVSLRFLLKGEHKEVHIHENFRNYGAWNGGCEVYALLLPLFQLKFRWSLQLGLYVCKYGLWLGLWKLFKAFACLWRHSLKECKVRQSLVKCSLVSQIWHTISWTDFNWPLFFNSSASIFLAKDANLAWRSWSFLRLYMPLLDVWGWVLPGAS